MVLAVSTSGLWRVLWYSLIGVGALTAYSAALRAAGVPWVRIRWSVIGAYAAVYIWWFFANGVIIDRISVLWSFAIFLGIASIGRPWREWVRMAGDLGIFVAMWIAYDESRGIADGLGMPIQVESVRNIDRFLFFGTDPVVDLQRRFYRGPADVQWYDVVGSAVYYSHFIVPPVVIAILWFRNRHQWVRYMRRFATLLFVACSMFILLPTAPPWMAAGGRNRVGLDLDALPPLSRPTGNGWRHIGLDGFVEAWDTGRDWANQVAALPSLHSAFALFVVVFFWPWITNRYVRWALLLYPAAMALALAYFAEHYFVDAFAGWAIVGGSFWLWNEIERRTERRDGAEPADAEGDSPDRAPRTADEILQPS
ncbi:MAG: phosphatase PAP2 family protein [Ilumatobacter sp.]|nr:phosphatase PAP2 family protein [Ilumatobacter sp.]